jgi:hypothetical protein
MMPNYMNPHYIINGKGVKTAVILSMREYHSLLEDLHDLAIVAERKGEPTLSYEEMIVELKNADRVKNGRKRI